MASRRVSKNTFVKKDVEESKMMNIDEAFPEDNSQITITPCTGLSAADFEEQKKSKTWAWDETDPKRTNFPPKKGQLFGFYAPPKKGVRKGWIQIHRVKEICSTQNRPSSWSKNVGQTDRKVLILTEPLCTIGYDEWNEMGGLKKQQGTYTSSLDKSARHKKLRKEMLKKIRNV